MSDRDGSGFLWFLAGLGIGAAVGVLYAPKSGDELRQQIREVAEDGRNSVKERARQAQPAEGSDSLCLRCWPSGVSRGDGRKGRRRDSQRSVSWRSCVDACI
jgi:hypothetical protein